MRTDPSDTGGLFVTRRPGTRPIQYREPPPVGDPGQRRRDGIVAAGLVVLMVLVNLTFWGPLPLACLWVGGHVQYLTDSIFGGLAIAFGTMIAGLLFGLMILKRLDYAWILVRRAAGHDQREGIIGRIFMICCMIAVPIFGFWFTFLSGANMSGLSVNNFLGN
jgi:hypothetical protein